MRINLFLESSDEEYEFANDFDWEAISDSKLLKFIKMTHFFEQTIIDAKISFNIYKEICSVVDLLKNKESEFFMLFSCNNALLNIVNKLYFLFGEGNKMNIDYYISFCRKELKNIFDSKNFLLIKTIKKEAFEIYSKKIKEIRQKYVAHSDFIMIDDVETVEKQMDDIAFEDIEKIINTTENILNIFWYEYRRKKLVYEIDNERTIGKTIRKIYKFK